MGATAGIAGTVLAVGIVAGGIGYGIIHHNHVTTPQPATAVTTGGAQTSQNVSVTNKATNSQGTTGNHDSSTANQTTSNTNSVSNSTAKASAPTTTSGTTPSASTSSTPSGIQLQAYSSSADATTQIAHLEGNFGQVYPSGPPVNLGSGIKANFSGAAGEYVYQWQEGHWTIDLRGLGNDAPGTQIAKNLASFLHTHYLPAPENKGAIIMEGTSSAWKTTIAWQQGNRVYQLKATGNPMNAVITVVNQK